MKHTPSHLRAEGAAAGNRYVSRGLIAHGTAMISIENVKCTYSSYCGAFYDNKRPSVRSPPYESQLSHWKD